MIAMLAGFAPFIAFFLVMRLATPEAGLAAAFAASLLGMLRSLSRGASLKLLEIASLALFGVLALYGLAAAPRWTVATVRLIVDGGLLAIVLATLLIGRPFTLQYARERVPAQYWTTPTFLATNRRITAAWALAFAVMAAADAAAAYCPAVPLALDIAATGAALAGAVWFTLWYPARLRRAL
jgi:hypothetical protein